ncbi:MAG: tetratricopeptide repeat protein, partial [Planctomycetota bacterium]
MEKPKSLTNITTILLLAFGLLALSTSFAVSLFTSAAEAKPATVRLQEGLYAEEIDGDLDAAMKIYEQIISDKSAQNSCVAKAMYRLGMCYIKKQNELQAKAVFEKLVVQFPEQTSIVEKVQPLLDKMSNPDPAALMPPDTKIYLEFGSPGRQIEKILNMLKGTPFENPLAALGGGKPGEKSPGDVMAALLNPSMIQEFKKIRGMAIGFTGIRGNNPPVIVVLYPGKSDALRGILLAGLGMVGTPGDPIEGMQTLIIQNTAGAAYDDEVIIMGQPLDQLTWSAKQYKGVTAEASLASENKLFSKLSRKSREENAVTIWLDGAATFAAISEQMARSGQSAQLRLVDGVADFGSVEEAIAHLRVEERGFATELSVGFKDGHRCLAYDLIRTPNLSTAGFEAVPVEAVGLVSFALGEAESGRMERMERTVKELTGLDIGRELFMNVEQVTLFALPPSPAFQENVLAQRFSPVLDRLGLVVTSKNPEQTRQLLSRFLTVAGLVGEASANAEVGREEGTVAGKYKIGVFDNQPAYCYMEQ